MTENLADQEEREKSLIHPFFTNLISKSQSYAFIKPANSKILHLFGIFFALPNSQKQTRKRPFDEAISIMHQGILSHDYPCL